MLYFVHIETRIPPDMPDETKDDLRRRELERACELLGNRNLQHIWRVVGKVGSFSVWNAAGHEELHALLQSMPYFPYMHISVTPITKHPAEELYGQKIDRTLGE